MSAETTWSAYSQRIGHGDDPIAALDLSTEVLSLLKLDSASLSGALNAPSSSGEGTVPTSGDHDVDMLHAAESLEPQSENVVDQLQPLPPATNLYLTAPSGLYTFQYCWARERICVPVYRTQSIPYLLTSPARSLQELVPLGLLSLDCLLEKTDQVSERADNTMDCTDPGVEHAQDQCQEAQLRQSLLAFVCQRQAELPPHVEKLREWSLAEWLFFMQSCTDRAIHTAAPIYTLVSTVQTPAVADAVLSLWIPRYCAKLASDPTAVQDESSVDSMLTTVPSSTKFLRQLEDLQGVFDSQLSSLVDLCMLHGSVCSLTHPVFVKWLTLYFPLQERDTEEHGGLLRVVAEELSMRHLLAQNSPSG
mmetsp:Transcript_18855/g.47958  ORF Transcript_18855/g.47958 Transcript_18855/m.47958 type:complete len:363 (-) Transcript_18855:254-1342(-)|eukprot:CAMPEP_0177640156 /NCGR_PEP_ID=MMETSP0447-20121125/6396_1 /TAXON_ID=0 /ORGANISM="Stygamoeba regulata, Strain BSH-02190019" /LENGTH=362 /DNA_ID=CAMNT_0019142215 /DNA_START=105 /DNA_END=1193 /DNA_ORIENTATION=-